MRRGKTHAFCAANQSSRLSSCLAAAVATHRTLLIERNSRFRLARTTSSISAASVPRLQPMPSTRFFGRRMSRFFRAGLGRELAVGDEQKPLCPALEGIDKGIVKGKPAPAVEPGGEPARRVDHCYLLIVQKQAVEYLHPRQVIDYPTVLLGQHVERGEAMDIGGGGNYFPPSGDEAHGRPARWPHPRWPERREMAKPPGIIHHHHRRIDFLA